VRIEGTHKTQAERRKAGRDIARNEVTVRAFTIKAKSLESAQSLFGALSRFDPILHGYSVSVDVGKGDRRIPEMLDAIHRHVEKGGTASPESSWTGGTTTSSRRIPSLPRPPQRIARRRCIVTIVPSANRSTTTESINSSMIARPSPPSSLADSYCHRP
jgi:hypothetical protein